MNHKFVIWCLVLIFIVMVGYNLFFHDQQQQPHPHHHHHHPNVYGTLAQLFVPEIVEFICKKEYIDLSGDQKKQLQQLLHKVCQAYIDGKEIRPLLTPIFALMLPRGGSELLDELLNYYFGEKKQQPKKKDDIKTKNVDIDQILISKYKIQNGKLNLLSEHYKELILKTLSTGEELICGITLEPILDPKTGYMMPNIVMIVQNDTHVFFFQKDAIDNWFRTGPRRVNPMTNTPVTTYYVLT